MYASSAKHAVERKNTSAGDSLKWKTNKIFNQTQKKAKNVRRKMREQNCEIYLEVS